MRILDRRSVQERQFSLWSLTNPTIPPAVEASLDGLLGPEMDAARVVQILRTLWRCRTARSPWGGGRS